MKKIDLKLTMQRRDGSKFALDWQGYATSAPGLAVCRIPIMDYMEIRHDGTPDEVKLVAGDLWEVVHVGSGRALPGCRHFRTRRDASQVAYKVAGLMDWGIDLEEYKTWARENPEENTSMQSKVKEIVGQYVQGW